MEAPLLLKEYSIAPEGRLELSASVGMKGLHLVCCVSTYAI
jgi:hypothetical protein